jgi:hypothetical protein
MRPWRKNPRDPKNQMPVKQSRPKKYLINYKNGDTYTGALKNSQRHGKGKFH